MFSGVRCSSASRMLLTAIVSLLAVTSGCAAPFRGRSGYAVSPGPSVHSAKRSGEAAGASVHGPAAGRLPELDGKAALVTYLRYAALNNPGLEASFNRWKASLERIPQVRSLPDPRFTFGYFFENVETRVGPQERTYSLAQQFPWFGKLRLQGGKAFQESESLREQYEATKLKLFYEVKHAYFEYYYLGRAIEIVEENRDLLKHLEGVARVRYKTATGRHPDVIRAQVELGKLEDRLHTLEDLRDPLRTRLNGALNRPPDSAIRWPRSAPRLELTEAASEILQSLPTDSPDLRRMDYEVAAQDYALALARKEYWPDLALGLTYIETGEARNRGVSGSGDDPVLGTISINLPIWLEKRRAGVREAKRMRLAARLQKEDLLNDMASKVKLILYRFRDAMRKVDLYRTTLLPKAAESFESTLTAYSAGNASFSDVVDAERVRLEFTLAGERSLADGNQRAAELEMVVGRELTRPRRPTEKGKESALRSVAE